MIRAIEKEIELFTGTDQPEDISTIYLGGGTPSILTNDELRLVFHALRKRFALAKDAEITLEANPDDISMEKLQQWQSLGINRLSVGIQSFQEEELKWMNRVHSASESLVCLRTIRRAGFHNFSVDLIYGSPLLSEDDWKRNLAVVFEDDVPHVSCYALTVEPKTALEKMILQNKREPVDPEKQARQFLLLMDWMGGAGYEHYEISNYAKPGFRSRHNSSYWQGNHYYGFGPGAHSFNGKKRKWNIANNALYIQSIEKDILPFEEETLTETQQLNEYIMTSLRTIEGLNLDLVYQKFGEEKKAQLLLNCKKYERSKKLELENDRLLLTKEGKLFADGIAADLFF